MIPVEQIEGWAGAVQDLGPQLGDIEPLIAKRCITTVGTAREAKHLVRLAAEQRSSSVAEAGDDVEGLAVPHEQHGFQFHDLVEKPPWGATARRDDAHAG